MDYLNEALINNYNVDLSSSVFIELTHNQPKITIWIEGKVIYITSTKDYNVYSYYDKNVIKICDIDDYDAIIDIYNSTYGYNSNEVKIKGLIEILNRQFGITK